MSVDYSVQGYLNAGVPASKIMVGVALGTLGTRRARLPGNLLEALDQFKANVVDFSSKLMEQSVVKRASNAD